MRTRKDLLPQTKFIVECVGDLAALALFLAALGVWAHYFTGGI